MKAAQLGLLALRLRAKYMDVPEPLPRNSAPIPNRRTWAIWRLLWQRQRNQQPMPTIREIGAEVGFRPGVTYAVIKHLDWLEQAGVIRRGDPRQTRSIALLQPYQYVEADE